MRMSETIAALRRAQPGMTGDSEGRLSELGEFGPNPGNLRGFYYVPEGVHEPAPLVVVLHGCTQSAASYDEGSGWSKLADRHGFILLFPEQRRVNNPNRCFSWFQASDTRRDSGEAASIRQMVDRIRPDHHVDPARIFVTGLSAGGAMASVMLAAYPDVFAAGAIIAGIAYGCAGSVGEAFACMSGGGRTSSTALGDNVRGASGHDGPWPRVSVWHGSADSTVTASNGDDIVKQWLNVHRLRAKPNRVDTVDGYPHRVWLGGDGRPAIEQYAITGMGHGTPLDPGEADGQSGIAGPHMLDVSISSTDRIAEFFGLTGAAMAARRAGAKRAGKPRKAALPKAPPPGVQQVIEDALRKAGLMP